MNPVYTPVKDETRAFTLGELCEALADGRLASEREDGYYLFTKGDLRRLMEPRERKPRVITLPTIDKYYAAG